MNRAIAAVAVVLAGCCGPRVVDLRPAIETCIAKGMLPGAVKVDADGKLIDGLCLEVRLQHEPQPGGASS